MCETVMTNNKLFPHLYDPFYDRKDVKKSMLKIVSNHRRDNTSHLESRDSLFDETAMQDQFVKSAQRI